MVKALAPVDGKAIVYIMRPGTLGFALMMRLDCDSFLVGWVGVKSYLYTIIPPGDHVFKARSENEYDLKVILEPGKIYYLEEDAKMGILYARTKLKQLSEEDGRKALAKCGLSGHNRYPSFPNSKDVERSPPKDER